ncbi:Esa1p-associated factor [Irineochytrium annulatum]|nr:Esa1p-associated factor [Irineochytrium annulatum]
MLFAANEKVLCYHGPLIYEAKVLKGEVWSAKPNKDDNGPHYFVHYKGWKQTWDEWVPEARVLKFNDENLKTQSDLLETLQSKKSKSTEKKVSVDSEKSATKKRPRETGEKEDEFVKRPEVKISIPESLKIQLVDDWENITKNQKVVVIPRNPNVIEILNLYRESLSKKNNGKESRTEEVGQEIVDGLKVYFDRALGSILLYRFERPQYVELRKSFPDKAMSEVFMEANAQKFFADGYEEVSPEYVAIAQCLWFRTCFNIHIMTTFADAFSTTNAKAKESSEILITRLRRGRQIDVEIADFIKERAAIEERYANELVKLSRKAIQIEREHMGGFKDVWDVIMQGTFDISEAHRKFSVSITDQIERTLRARGEADVTWAKQKQYEIELAKMVKDYDDEYKRIRKSDGSESKGLVFFKKSKARDTALTADTKAALVKADEVFTSKALPMYQRFQTMDESRISFLKGKLELYASSEAALVKGMSEGNNQGFTATFGDGGSGSETPGKTSVTAPTDSNIVTQPLVDSEGFSLPPANDFRWQPPNNDSDDEKDDASDPAAPQKLKISIKSDAIEDSPDAALKTMQTLAATLQSMPTTKRRASERQNGALPEAKAKPLDVPLFAEPQGMEEPLMAPMQPAVFATSPSPRISVDSNILETVNVIVHDGEIDKLMLTGEIKVSLSEWFGDLQDTRLRIVNHPVLEKVVLNPNFATEPDAARPDEISLNTRALSQQPNASATILKYKVLVDAADQDAFAPLLVNAIWKSEASHVSILLVYQYNEEVRSRIPLKDVTFYVSLAGELQVGNVQTKPTGLWYPEKKALLWKVGDVDADITGAPGETSPTPSQEPHKLLARFERVSGEPISPGTVNVRFVSPMVVSGVSLEALDKEVLTVGKVSYQTSTGKYAAL